VSSPNWGTVRASDAGKVLTCSGEGEWYSSAQWMFFLRMLIHTILLDRRRVHNVIEASFLCERQKVVDCSVGFLWILVEKALEIGRSHCTENSAMI